MADLCKLSASIVADSVERSFLLKVDGYSSAKQRFKTGECLASPLLSFKGHDWVLKYYPNGDSEAGAIRYISLDVECSDAKDDLPVPAIRLCHRDELILVPPYVVGTSYTQPFCSVPGLSSYHLFVIDQAKLEQSGDIIDDCFSIRCVLPTEKTMGDQFVVLPPSDLHLHFGNLLETMDGADVAYLVGGEKFSAHRLVLAARSSVFRAELLGPMKEKADNPIEIVDMEALVFKSLLHFIYTDSLPDLQMTRNQGEARIDVMMASHLLVAADRYSSERLKLICEHKLCSHIDANMVATSLALAEQHRCNGLKEACLKFLASPSNLEAMVTSDGYKHLKSSCPSALKELIARLLPANMKAAKDIVMAL